MTATVMPVPIQQFFDADGDPLASGRLYTYEAGTSTPIAVYSDVDLTIPYSNPIVLDSAGRTAGPVYPPVTAVKYVLKDANLVTIWTADDVIASAPATAATPACVAPVITVQPANTTIVHGNSATLTVTVTGTSPITYQWYLGSSGDTSNPIDGATASSYTAVKVAAGTYTGWVRASNACGTVDSTTATLTVT